MNKKKVKKIWKRQEYGKYYRNIIEKKIHNRKN